MGVGVALRMLPLILTEKETTAIRVKIKEIPALIG